MNQTFSQRVRMARDYRALRQRELAECSGLHRVHISDIERGKVGKRPAPETVRKLVAALRVNVGWLATGIGAMTDPEN